MRYGHYYPRGLLLNVKGNRETPGVYLYIICIILKALDLSYGKILKTVISTKREHYLFF